MPSGDREERSKSFRHSRISEIVGRFEAAPQASVNDLIKATPEDQASLDTPPSTSRINVKSIINKFDPSASNKFKWQRSGTANSLTTPRRWVQVEKEINGKVVARMWLRRNSASLESQTEPIPIDNNGSQTDRRPPPETDRSSQYPRDHRHAELRHSGMMPSEPRYAIPSDTDPRAADLRAADPRAADLRAADLRAADLRAADPRAADPRPPLLKSSSSRELIGGMKEVDLSSAETPAMKPPKAIRQPPTASTPVAHPAQADRRSECSSRASHFIAFRVDDVDCVNRLVAFQNIICNQYPFLKICRTNPSKFHLTLLVLSLKAEEVDRAIEAMIKGVNAYRTKIGSLLNVEFRTVGAFNARLLFVAPSLQQRLLLDALHLELAKACGEANINIVGAGGLWSNSYRDKRDRKLHGGGAAERAAAGGNSGAPATPAAPTATTAGDGAPTTPVPGSSSPTVSPPSLTAPLNSSVPQSGSPSSLGGPSGPPRAALDSSYLPQPFGRGKFSSVSRFESNSDTYSISQGEGNSECLRPIGLDDLERCAELMTEDLCENSRTCLIPTALDLILLKKYDISGYRNTLYVPQVSIFKTGKANRRGKKHLDQQTTKMKVFPRLYHSTVQKILTGSLWKPNSDITSRKVITQSVALQPPFGSQSCDKLELVEMSLADEDGYYKRLFTMNLSDNKI